MMPVPWSSILWILTLCVFAIFFLLPPFVELKSPRDNGPRRVAERTMGFRGKKVLRLGVDTIRIIDNMEFPSDCEVKENIVVEGSLVIGDRCHFYGSIKASDDVDISSKAVIEGSLIAGGYVKLRKDVVIMGSLDAKGPVSLGENSFVGLSLTSSGDVEMERGAKVIKNIFSQGHIRVTRTPET